MANKKRSSGLVGLLALVLLVGAGWAVVSHMHDRAQKEADAREQLSTLAARWAVARACLTGEPRPPENPENEDLGVVLARRLDHALASATTPHELSDGWPFACATAVGAARSLSVTVPDGDWRALPEDAMEDVRVLLRPSRDVREASAADRQRRLIPLAGAIRAIDEALEGIAHDVGAELPAPEATEPVVSVDDSDVLPEWPPMEGCRREPAPSSEPAAPSTFGVSPVDASFVCASKGAVHVVLASAGALYWGAEGESARVAAAIRLPTPSGAEAMAGGEGTFAVACHEGAIALVTGEPPALTLTSCDAASGGCRSESAAIAVSENGASVGFYSDRIAVLAAAPASDVSVIRAFDEELELVGARVVRTVDADDDVDARPVLIGNDDGLFVDSCGVRFTTTDGLDWTEP